MKISLMLKKVWITLLIYLTSALAENLGNCFRDNDDASCENSRVNILGESYECKVLQKFDDLTSYLSYTKEKIYLTAGKDKYMYDLELNTIVPAKYRIPSPVKVITRNDTIFTGGSGKVIVSLPEADEYLYINTYDDMTDDEIDIYNKSEILFILSRFPKENNINKNVGLLYAFDIKSISAENVFAEKVNTDVKQFSSMLVIPEKDILLLLIDETSYSKLVSISLIPSEPCKTEIKKANLKPSDVPLVIGELKNGSITEILNEVDIKLVKILDKLSASTNGSTHMPIVVNANSVNFEKKFNDLKIKYNKLNQTFYGSMYSYGAPKAISPQAITSSNNYYNRAEDFQNQQNIGLYQQSDPGHLTIYQPSNFGPPTIPRHLVTQPPNFGPPTIPRPLVQPTPNLNYPINFSNQNQPSVPVDSVLKMFFNLLKQERIYNMKLQNQINKLNNEIYMKINNQTAKTQ